MDKRKKWLIAGFVAVWGVTTALWLRSRSGGTEPIRVLERNPPGMGDSEIQMEIRTEEGNFPINFLLKERRYREEELEKFFSRERPGWTVYGWEIIHRLRPYPKICIFRHGSKNLA